MLLLPSKAAIVTFPVMVNTCENTLESRLAEVYAIAQAEIGVNEATNPERIKEYERTTTLPLRAISEKTPWCSCFVSWVLEKAGFESTDSAWALSYLHWGKQIDEPIQGALVCLKRGVSNGHVAFFSHYSDDKTKIFLLGGNQANSVCVMPFDEHLVIGYRVPAYE